MKLSLAILLQVALFVFHAQATPVNAGRATLADAKAADTDKHFKTSKKGWDTIKRDESAVSDTDKHFKTTQKGWRGHKRDESASPGTDIWTGGGF